LLKSEDRGLMAKAKTLQLEHPSNLFCPSVPLPVASPFTERRSAWR